jgi:hypothetical protein
VGNEARLGTREKNMKKCVASFALLGYKWRLDCEAVTDSRANRSRLGIVSPLGQS